jgi:hypothetical protein
MARDGLSHPKAANDSDVTVTRRDRQRLDRGATRHYRDPDKPRSLK